MLNSIVKTACCDSRCCDRLSFACKKIRPVKQLVVKDDVGLVASLGCQRFGRICERDYFFRQNRFAIKVALELMAAILSQKIDLLDRFNALGNDL